MRGRKTIPGKTIQVTVKIQIRILLPIDQDLLPIDQDLLLINQDLLLINQDFIFRTSVHHQLY